MSSEEKRKQTEEKLSRLEFAQKQLQKENKPTMLNIQGSPISNTQPQVVQTQQRPLENNSSQGDE